MPFISATHAMGKVLAEHHAAQVGHVAEHPVVAHEPEAKAKRGDVVVFAHNSTSSYVNGPNQTHTRITVGEVTAATRDGQVKEFRDFEAGAPQKLERSGLQHAQRFILPQERIADKAGIEHHIRSRGPGAGPTNTRSGFEQTSGTWESPKGSLLTQVEKVDTAHLAKMYAAETAGDSAQLGELRRQADSKTENAFNLGYRNPRTAGYRPIQSIEEAHAALKPYVHAKPGDAGAAAAARRHGIQNYSSMTNQDKIAAAAKMYGHGSKQHAAAIEKYQHR